MSFAACGPNTLETMMIEETAQPEAEAPSQQVSPNNDLLPCPFCGGTDLFAERKDLSETVIQCNDCGVFGPGGCPENDDDLEREEAQDLNPGELMARRLWNQRAR